MTPAQKISSALALLAVGLAVSACGSAPASDPVLTGAAGEALACQSGGLHVEGCPITKPSPDPQPPTCAVMTNCSGTTQATFDPLWYPATAPDGGLGTYWAVDQSFATLLSSYGCEPEVSFYEGDAWEFATSICPRSIAGAIDATAAADSRAIVSEIGCNTCTGQPAADQIVVAWLTNPGFEPVCVPAYPSPICDEPGPGCNSIGCMTY